MTGCSYVPGTWPAVVCERLVALVGPATPEASVAALWDAAAAGGGVHEALEALAGDGTATLPPFALVTLSRSGLLHAALRGDVEAAIGSSSGTRGLRTADDAPWTEVTAHDVPRLSLRAVDGGATGGSPLPLVAGVVLAAEVRASADLWGAPRPDEPGTVLDDHEGLTIATGDLAELRPRVRPVAPPPPPPPPAPAARLVLSTGLVVPLDRAVLLGRAPQVGRVSARELPRLVTVPSPEHDVSRTHAEVRVEGEHVLVTDLESLNGTRVVRPDGTARRLHPGEPTVVGPGEVVDLGDGVTFLVETSA
jgi:hypothetical protein